MKIKFISTYPPFKCGIADYTKRLMTALKREGINAEIIKIDYPSSPNAGYFEKIAVKASENMGSEDIIHIQFQITRFGRILCIIPGFHIITLLRKIKSLTKAKIIITFHDIPSKKDAKGMQIKLKGLLIYYKLIYKSIRKYCSKVIVHSENARSIAIDEWKFEKNKIKIMPIGLPDKIIILNKEKCRKKLGLVGKKVILAFGYARKYKNYDLVLEALKELDDEVILAITGGVQSKKHQKVYESFLKKVNSLGLGKRVKTLGFVEDKNLPEVLNAADIGILPYTKTFGDFSSAAMAEQIAYQIPVLAADIHPFEKFKARYRCIETFEKENIKDLIKKIKILLYDKRTIKNLKTNSREYWQKNKLRNVARAYKKFYAEISKD